VLAALPLELIMGFQIIVRLPNGAFYGALFSQPSWGIRKPTLSPGIGIRIPVRLPPFNLHYGDVMNHKPAPGPFVLGADPALARFVRLIFKHNPVH
jgi:hypothetical protein